jgi:hypothetical protein
MLANTREHLLPRGAFGHRPDLPPGLRHGGPTMPSGLEEQHPKALTMELKFHNLAHRLSLKANPTQGCLGLRNHAEDDLVAPRYRSG